MKDKKYRLWTRLNSRPFLYLSASMVLAQKFTHDDRLGQYFSVPISPPITSVNIERKIIYFLNSSELTTMNYQLSEVS
jgi:hypothetical protein